MFVGYGNVIAINLSTLKLDRISCEYCPIHYGHDTKNPCRQILTKEEKEWILQLLVRGWNSDEIVKTLRNGTITGMSFAC